MKRTIIFSFAESLNLKNRPDAHLLLTKQSKRAFDFDVRVIKFASRKALEEFNKKAGLKAVVPTQVPLNCVVWKHETDSDARLAKSNENLENKSKQNNTNVVS